MGKDMGRPTWSPFSSRFCPALGILGFVFLLFFIILFNDRQSKRGGNLNYYESMKNLNPLQFCKPSLDVDYIQNNLEQFDQMDHRLIEYTRVKYLSPPSKLPYTLEGATTTDFKNEFSDWVAKFFKGQAGGVFIEAGAHDGGNGSHTLYLEKELGWNGLLIECDPTVVPSLKSLHRKAWVADVCIAPTTAPGLVNFSNPTNSTYIGPFDKPIDVQTMPFYTILAALGWTEADYLSFDINGLELAVLKTFPFHLFTFKVVIIEVMFYTTEMIRELHELLLTNDYYFVKDMHVDDKIYVHNSVKHMIPVQR